MTTRLLAVVLTLLIGSPVCWCCVTHAAPLPSEESEAPACPMCAKEATSGHRESGSTQKKGGCQCEKACSAREITQPTIAIPAASESNLPAIAWVWEDRLFEFGHQKTRTRELPVLETGPPRPDGPLYLRHCALLN